jgi:uncharacterized protein YbaR (Trm112 family)
MRDSDRANRRNVDQTEVAMSTGPDDRAGQPAGPAGDGPEPSASQTETERVDRRLLELLVCPVTKGLLEYDATRQELISRKARLAYPIRRGVPHLLPSEARHLDD